VRGEAVGQRGGGDLGHGGDGIDVHHAGSVARGENGTRPV
jgi:hypothetical protein